MTGITDSVSKLSFVNQSDLIRFKSAVTHPFIKPRQAETYNPFDTLKIIKAYEKLKGDYLNPAVLNYLLQQNSEIPKIASAYNFQAAIHPENIEQQHLIQTADMALKLAYIEGIALTPQKYNDIVTAAILHDVGKTLIPPEILHKQSALTYDEKQIIGLHTKLGYELIKNTDLSDIVKATVKNHHNFNDKNEIINLIKIADMYSALSSARAYKKAFSQEQTMQIIGESRDKGKIANKEYLALQTVLKAG